MNALTTLKVAPRYVRGSSWTLMSEISAHMRWSGARRECARSRYYGRTLVAIHMRRIVRRNVRSAVRRSAATVQRYVRWLRLQHSRHNSFTRIVFLLLRSGVRDARYILRLPAKLVYQRFRQLPSPSTRTPAPTPLFHAHMRRMDVLGQVDGLPSKLHTSPRAPTNLSRVFLPSMTQRSPS